MTEGCCAAWTVAEHEAAVGNMAAYFGEVTTPAEIEAVWASTPTM